MEVLPNCWIRQPNVSLVSYIFQYNSFMPLALLIMGWIVFRTDKNIFVFYINLCQWSSSSHHGLGWLCFQFVSVTAATSATIGVLLGTKCQAITRNNNESFSITLLRTIFSDICVQIQQFSSKQYIWKFQNIGHFVETIMCCAILVLFSRLPVISLFSWCIVHAKSSVILFLVCYFCGVQGAQ